MKKLGKLTVNEMRDYVPLNPEEQMAMKGGVVMTPYHWITAIYTAWKLSKEIMEMVNGSGGSSQGSTINVDVYGSDSVKVLDSGIYIYQTDSTRISVSR